ncbi:hypothetical protein [Clostridium vincentii]|uniref:Uncharacterized protein n=1 Tax=Clostridium vincentii TaxID=52704 RepID=A0A2T0BD25_9CLOT|nr:hypothetical protein [Clostridium vincentii]PRR81791.1 hypothetical protein CLVI_22800 [Clostridium vincentii]
MSKVVKKNMAMGKTDYDIPTFSFKSAFVLVAAGALATFIVPFLLSLVGIDRDISIVLGSGIILGGALAYSRFFIETKRGKCKKFWYTYLGFGVIFLIISFFWVYLGSYI